MRQTYETRKFTFDNPVLKGEVWPEPPNRIIIHRQGNPGASALNALTWGNRTGTFSIHCYIEDEVCYEALEANVQAYHVKETKWARAQGFATPNGRGDYRAYGIETVDILGGAPGQEYSLSQETRITLLLAVRDVCRQFNISPVNVFEHAELDPVTREHDLGDALNMVDFREDLNDILNGREPWRTVGKFATGQRAIAPEIPPQPQTIEPVILTKLPVEGRVTYPFGTRVPLTYPGEPPPTAQEEFHNGVDIACDFVPLFAPAVGVASYSGDTGGFSGKAIIIRCTDGTGMVFYHLDRVDVLAGAQITKGQMLGVTGNTGRSTGPHLHYGRLKPGFNGNAFYFGDGPHAFIDPLAEIAANTPQPEAQPSAKAEAVRKLEEVLEYVKGL